MAAQPENRINFSLQYHPPYKYVPRTMVYVSGVPAFESYSQSNCVYSSLLDTKSTILLTPTRCTPARALSFATILPKVVPYQLFSCLTGPSQRVFEPLLVFRPHGKLGLLWWKQRANAAPPWAQHPSQHSSGSSLILLLTSGWIPHCRTALTVTSSPCWPGRVGCARICAWFD